LNLKQHGFFTLTIRSNWARIKNVIELSVLCRESGAASAQEYELTSNASIELQGRDRIFAIPPLI
jgi:hypothetical protein